MNNKEIIFHLSLIDGIGPVTIKKILDQKPIKMELADLYKLRVSDFVHVFGMSKTGAQKIVDGLRNKKNLEKELRLIETHNISWTVLGQDGFPKLLSEIYAPPSVFYFQGAGFFDEKNMAVIGSRKAHRYAQQTIEYFVPELIEHGWTIVSGGAIGADSMAHHAAVQARGKTVVVLGSGLLKPYPASNRKLFNEVLQNGGTILSAFPLQTEARPGNFPARNRIIAGLSHGCMVVQAAEKSGARITAQFALEQGREVFAVPGPIGDELSIGCHALIQEGAKLIGSVKDILVEFDPLFVENPSTGSGCSSGQAIKKQVAVQKKQRPVAPSAPVDSRKDLSSLTDLEADIVRACSVASTADDIACAVKVEPGVLHERLLDLQFSGYIRQNFAGLWEQTP